MKRLVLLFIAFSLFLCANAQIRSSFYGCKLGVTTKKQVLDNLKQLGHKIQYDKENNCYYIENVTFAGERWNLCQFEFYKDTLALVGFGLLSDNEDVVDLYNRNLENVKTKYDKIECKIICDETNRKLCSFDDGITILGISYDIEEENVTILIYQSKRLINLMDEDAYNDI